MNGLEEIILAIRQKAAAEGEEIKKRAKAEADKIRDEAALSAADEGEKILSEASRRCAHIKEVAESAAVSNRSKELLKYKSQTVQKVINDLLDGLRALPEKEYFDVLEQLVLANYHENESGIILFGKTHEKSIPADFLDKINEKLAEKGAALSKGGTADIPDGFILRYGDIEENCAFEAIVTSGEETLKDRIASILFA